MIRMENTSKQNNDGMLDKTVSIKGICVGIDEKTGNYQIKLTNPNYNTQQMIQIHPDFIQQETQKNNNFQNSTKLDQIHQDPHHLIGIDQNPVVFVDENVNKGKTIIHSHLKMKKLGIIVDPRAGILIDTFTNFNYARVSYEFQQINNDIFRVRVEYRVRFGAKQYPFKKGIIMCLTDLEKRWKMTQRVYELDVSETEIVTMNLFKLIQFLKTAF